MLVAGAPGRSPGPTTAPAVSWPVPPRPLPSFSRWPGSGTSVQLNVGVDPTLSVRVEVL